VNFIKKKGDWHLFSNKTGLSREKALELLTLAGNMLVDENVYNEYTNSTKNI
jgi:hypothetical protein